MSRGRKKNPARRTGPVDAAIPPLPPDYLIRMERLLGAEYPAFRAAYDRPAQSGLRVNALKVTPERFTNISPFALEPTGLAAEAFLIADSDRPGAHPYHAAGLYYLQDPSAMAVVPLLDPQPGERILDLAAAPGGKATHIAARLAGRGVLIANEVHPKRAWDLAENLERWGARNAVILNEDPARLADRLSGYFDRVLLDAPCSGEGLFRKTPAARAEWSAALVEGCGRRQDALLTHARRLVRQGGVLVYSTCTFAPEEDEAVIGRFLTDHPDFELAATTQLPGFTPGRPSWVAGEPTDPLRRTVRLWPHIGPGEGHFIAVLRRIGRPEPAEPVEGRRSGSAPAAVRAATQYYRTFCDEHLTGAPGADRLTLEGAYLYAPPVTALPLDDLRVIHPGWWLGVIKTGRFEPSHALALALTPADVRQSLDLAPDDPRLSGYLRGAGFSDPGRPAWVLVTVDGFPVGWGKRVTGMLKSHYPKGLRRP
jgi:NOL1/NOP2/sun family putative RNA methylase